ncbi:MAG: nucleotidyltransferase family protein [Thermoanaerobaculia bacterium]
MSATVVAILAGGGSRRMGRPKLALPYRGKHLLVCVADTALAAGIGPVVVILGGDAEVYVPLLAGLQVRVVMNESWRDGMASSLRAAVTAAREAGAMRLLLMLADQPGVTSSHLQALAREESAVAATGYDFGAGPPAMFAEELWDALEALRGDEGARSVLRALTGVGVVPASWPPEDVDAPDDYRRLVNPEEGA